MRMELQQKNCLYFLLLVLYPLIVYGQKSEEPFPFTHIEYYGTGQGLNGALVWHVTQDSRGFLWFITDMALNRFDGYSFRSWSYNARDPNSLRIGEHQGLTEDKNGILWMSGVVPQGLYSFDPKREKFINYRHQPGNSNSPAWGDVNQVQADANGMIWAATRF